LLLTSRTSALWQLYVFYGVVLGIGTSAFDVVILSTITRWFIKKRGIITGVAKVGAGVGHMGMPLVAGALVASRDWRYAYVVLGVLALVVIVAASQFLKRDPAAMHLRPDDGVEANLREPQVSEVGLSLKQATRRRQFWLLFAAYFTIVFTTYTIQVHIAPHAIDLGNSVTQAAGVLAIIGAASTIGRLTMGKAGDALGSRKAMMICAGILSVTLLWLAFAGERWMLYVFAPVYGFAHGGSYSLISPMVAGLFGTGSHGAIYGLIIFGGTIGGTIGPFLAGYVFDTTSSYRVVFLVLSVLAVAGLLLLTSLRQVTGKEGKA
ncbi:MAG: hypothetical protein A2147_04970, partial [Chloroflexi bacterium RBG_16_57_8]